LPVVLNGSEYIAFFQAWRPIYALLSLWFAKVSFTSTSYSKSSGSSPFSCNVNSWRRAIEDASASVKAREKLEKEDKRKEKKKKQPKTLRGSAITDYLGSPKAAYRRE
jgi:hypothetical protein